ncbi:MAG: AI-2E family transporter [Oscillospiraceae bacterium]
MKKNEAYIKCGLTVFLTVCAILLVYDTCFGGGMVKHGMVKLFGILAPVLYGVFIAYLLTPVVNYFEKRLFVKQTEKARAAGKLRSLGARTVSLLLTFFVVFVLFYILLSILIPELYKSIVQLVNNAETYYNTMYTWVNNLLNNNQELERWVTAQLDASYKDLLAWLTQTVMPHAQQLLTAVTGGVVGTILFAKDLAIGLIVSVYLLSSKEGCAASGRRFLYAALPQDRARFTLRGVHRVDFIFSGFVRGKLLDSLIIGILCFICCSILKFPYTPLVSVIVGVTNVIPFFGPFLGAIPSAFLILLVSPLQCLYFLLFVLALQQLDGNVIGPKILGDSTGLSSFWVIVAILVGGGFFGLPGMFFGVPTFACVYTAIQFYTAYRLRKRNLPVEESCYTADEPAMAEGLPGEGREQV